MVSHTRWALTTGWRVGHCHYHSLPSRGTPTLPAFPGSTMVQWVGNAISGGGWVVMNWEKPAWALACVLPRLCFVKRERGLPHHLFLESGDAGLVTAQKAGSSGPRRREGWAPGCPPHASLLTLYPPHGLHRDFLTSRRRWPATSFLRRQGNKDLPTCAHHVQKDVIEKIFI